METPLFREEVISARHSDWLGSILVAAPLSRWILSILALVLAAVIVLLLTFGEYTRRESVSGQLVPMAGLLNIAAPGAGTITRLKVHEGQQVNAGDVLFELSTEQDSATLGDAHAIISQELATQRARLQADISDEQVRTAKQVASLHAKVALLRVQLSTVDDQLRIQQQRIDSNQDLVYRIKPLLEKGYVSILQIKQQENVVLDGQAQYKVLARQRLDAQQQLESAEQELALLPLDTAGKRNDIERQLAAIAQSTAQNEMQRAIVLRAPCSGVVSALLVKEGQMTSADQTLLSILPAGSTLEAQLLVPSRAIGFIEPGNRVVLRYQAFPYQKFGQHYGRIVDISRSALSPAQASALSGQQASEPLYRVMVSLDSQQVVIYGRTEAVRPGMLLDADILMERRRMIEWLFEPLYGIRNRLGRGPENG